jgi:hypothetical protein
MENTLKDMSSKNKHKKVQHYLLEKKLNSNGQAEEK